MHRGSLPLSAGPLGRVEWPGLRLGAILILGSPGWGNDEREDHRCCHHPRDHMQRSAIGAIDLLHVSNKERPKRARETPGSEHETINRTDILRSKVIGRECGHGSKSSAIAHQHEEGDYRQ